MTKSLSDYDVRVEKLDGTWAVFVVADGETARTNFEAEEVAKNFAAGERARLGLCPASKEVAGATGPHEKTLDGEAGIIDTNEM